MNDLLQACLQNKPGAAAQFIRRTTPIVYSAVAKTLRRGAVDASLSAEDVCQDIFLKLFAGDARLLRSFDPDRSALSTWLTVVSQRAALDVLRKKQLPTAGADASDLHLAADPAPAAQPIRFPKGLLSDRQALVLRLTFDQDRSPEEIARLLGVDIQTVRSTKHKAINKLREHYQPGE